ncbi:hypothetical protein Avbf_02726 [Armadillidium vulgare]|nr:hypothetical protein Avbf_02726 [Armadillidium vulgare]
MKTFFERSYNKFHLPMDKHSKHSAVLVTSAMPKSLKMVSSSESKIDDVADVLASAIFQGTKSFLKEELKKEDKMESTCA